jgi:hypothetical protein
MSKVLIAGRTTAESSTTSSGPDTCHGRTRCVLRDGDTGSRCAQGQGLTSGGVGNPCASVVGVGL